MSDATTAERICEECGGLITNPRNKRFCGRTCTGKWLGSTFPGSVTRRPTFVDCGWCGTSFYRPSKAVRFCSVTCAARWRGVQARKLSDRPCDWCKANFTPPRTSSRFCTASCRARWVNAQRPKRPKVPSSHLRQAERGGLPKAQFLLWQALGDDWHPQYWMSPLGDLGDDVIYFQIDLALPAKHLAVEVDGNNHRYLVDKDQRRDQWLIRNGWTVLRFSDEEIRTSIESVVEKIRSQENAALWQVD